MNLFYADNDEQKGPIDEAEFKRLKSLGQIRDNSLVFTQGMQDWLPLSEAVEKGFVKVTTSEASVVQPPVDMTPAAVGGERVACPNCGHPVNPADLIPFNDRQVCPNCRGLALQQIREGGAELNTEFRYAGFWIRVASSIIDSVIVQTFAFVVGLIFGLVGGNTIFQDQMSGVEIFSIILYYVVLIFGPMLYVAAFMGNSKMQATPGMLVTRLRVIRPDGSNVTFLRAFCRNLATILSQLILYIGYFMLLWDDEKRTLHDRIADTRIVYR